jgi:hypothetical protein
MIMRNPISVPTYPEALKRKEQGTRAAANFRILYTHDYMFSKIYHQVTAPLTSTKSPWGFVGSVWGVVMSREL